MRLSVLLVVLMVPQMMWGWSRVRNGGGGFYQDGQYLTFYSAKIQVRSTPMKLKEVPGLALLINKINQAPLNPQIKGSLLSLIYPSGSSRTYYQISEKDLTTSQHQDLIEEYRRLTGEPESNLVLFGMTNDKAETFLMPEFYKLNEIQQATILFHESLWNLQVEISYDQMVDMEMAAEAYFTNPYDQEAIFDFYDKLGRMLSLKSPVPEVLLQAGFYYTFMQHPPEHPQRQSLPISEVLYFDFLQCYQSRAGDAQNLPDCSKRLQATLMVAGTQRDLTLFERALLNVLNDVNFKGFLCLRESYPSDIRQSLFDSDISGWMKKTTIDTVELWQENDNLSSNYFPYKSMNKLFKIYEGDKYWGSLGLCYVPAQVK
ncbi:MAG: hypothetical protein JSU04_13640 [Bdellovibrionales bacterium]|nr:hypothetical protein [Bdellovibrionales bacterium]